MSLKQHFDCFWAIFSCFSIMAVLQNFNYFQVFVFVCRAHNKNLEMHQMLKNLSFDPYFNFLSDKKLKSRLNLINLEGPEALKRKINIWYMVSSADESFWFRCHLNSILTVFEATLSCFYIMAFWWNFLDFRVSVFGYRTQNANLEIMENYGWGRGSIKLKYM